jgi:O-antigen/teichoic acid export membrane protein
MIKALLKESGIYAIPTLLVSLAGFFMLPVYTRILTPADYGLLETVTKITDMFGLLLGAGIADALVRFYSTSNNQEQKNNIVVTAFSLIMLFSLAGGLLFAVLSKPLAQFFLNSSDHKLLLISFASVAVGLLLRISLTVYRCDSRAWLFAGVSIGMLVTQIVFNVIALFLFKLGVSGIILSTLIATALWSAVTIVPIYYKKRGAVNREWSGKLLSYGYPLVFAALAQFVLNFSDRFFLVRNSGMDALGIYSIAYRMGMLVTVVFSIVGQSWWPAVFRMAKQPDAVEKLRRSNAVMSLLSASACVGVILFAKPLIDVMTTPQFRSAYLLVPPIAAAYWIFCTVNGPLSVALKIRNRTGIFAVINVISALFCLALSFLLIPKYGVWGAAYVTLLSFGFQVLPACYWGYRCWPELFDFLPILTGLAGVAGAAAVTYMLSSVWYVELPLRIFALLVCLGGYAFFWVSRYGGGSLADLKRLVVNREPG